jgi:hypothetical protein
VTTPGAALVMPVMVLAAARADCMAIATLLHLVMVAMV